MRPLRYSINVTFDGCVDHQVIPADEASHRYWAASLDRVDWNAELRSGAVALRYEPSRVTA